MAEEMLKAIDVKCQKLKYDKSSKALITNALGNKKYEVLINNSTYTATCLSDDILSVNQIVYVIAPQGNYSDLYIVSTSTGSSNINNNVIEIIQKNGVPLSVSNKTVNIDVPTKTSDLNNDSNFLNQDDLNSVSVNSASKLSTPRKINNVLFDGTQDITIEDNTKEPIISKNTAFNVDFETDNNEIKMNGIAFTGNSINVSRADHTHPSDTSRAPISHTHTASSITDFASAVLNRVLTGFSVGQNSSVSVSDTILSAFGKLQSQITNILNKFSNVDNTADKDKSVASAEKLTNSRIITLTDDASGIVQFDGSQDVSISVVVKDNSHNHIISNIDSLQSSLDEKVSNSQVGIVDGIAQLDENGVVPLSQLPDIDCGTFEEEIDVISHNVSQYAHPIMQLDGNATESTVEASLESHMTDPYAHGNLYVDGNSNG